MKRFLLILLIAAAGCTAGNSGEDVASDNIRADFHLIDKNGEEFSLENESENYLFVNFWATWCKPCIAELPSIDALQDSLRASPVTFLLVTNESPDKTRDFLEKRNIDIPGYHMQDAVEAFGLIGFPTTMLISPDGNVLLKVEGADEWNETENVNKIRDLIAGESKG